MLTDTHVCLLCNKPDRGYIPSPDTDFICGSCVQLLLITDKDELQAAHAVALEKGCLGNAKAIEIFLRKGR